MKRLACATAADLARRESLRRIEFLEGPTQLRVSRRAQILCFKNLRAEGSMRAGVLGAAFAGMCTCGATALRIRGCCGAAGAARLCRASSKAAGTAGCLPASAASAMLLAVGTCGRISELSVLLGLLTLSVHTRGVRSGDESSRCAAP